MVGSFFLSSACFCRDYTVGIIWREKKSFFPPQVGNIPAEVGKNPTQKRRTIVLGTVVCVKAEFFAYIPWSVMRFEYPKGYANAFAPFCSDGFCCIPVTTNFAYLFAYPLPASRF